MYMCEEVRKMVMTGREAAKYLGIHINTLYKSSIPHFRIGRNRYYRISTIEQLIDDLETVNGRIITKRDKEEEC